MKMSNIIYYASCGLYGFMLEVIAPDMSISQWIIMVCLPSIMLLTFNLSKR